MMKSLFALFAGVCLATLVAAVPSKPESAGRDKPFYKGFVGSALLAGPSSESSLPAHQSGGAEYVVLFNSSHSSYPHANEVLSRIGLTTEHSDVKHIFNNSAFRGFSASMKSHCVDALNAMDDVAIVSRSVKVSSHVYTRGSAPWGLQRVSSTNTVGGDANQLAFTYTYDDAALGTGVDIYVVDTGIYTDHLDFHGRARQGWTYNSSLLTDGDGHGTHVSGTATASTFGVASMANLIGVKVLDDEGGGNSADTIKGLDWVVQQHDARRSDPDFVGSVISMSWSLSTESHIDAAIAAAVEQAGMHAVVAAGNTGGDSCAYSPSCNGGANGPAISVGAVGPSNAIAWFSNTGACTDIYAPGEQVISAWIGQPNMINILDGTSMATPHVTGLVATLMLQRPELARDPAAMKKYVLATALQGQVTGYALGGDQKLLLNNGVTTAEKRRSRASRRNDLANFVMSADGPRAVV